MSVQTVRFDRLRAHVRAGGDIDLSTAAPLWAVLDGHLAAGRRFLRLDLSEVTFLDATGLSGVTRVHHEALSRRGTLVLTGIHTHIAKLLQLTGLDEVLLIGGQACV
jgi:anti-sigma B factor antagonist